MKSALFAAIAASVTLVAVPAAQQRETRERHVYIGVTDKAGTPVPTLAPADVVVKEDGATREVTKISPAPPPSHLMLLVDDSAIAELLIPDLRIALAGFLKIVDGMSPVPQVALMTFGDRPTMVVPYSETTLPVAEAVGKMFSRPQSGAHFLDAIMETAAGMRRAKAPRPVIVAFVGEGGAGVQQRHPRSRRRSAAGGARLALDRRAAGARPGRPRTRRRGSARRSSATSSATAAA